MSSPRTAEPSATTLVCLDLTRSDRALLLRALARPGPSVASADRLRLVHNLKEWRDVRTPTCLVLSADVAASVAALMREVKREKVPARD